MTQFLTGDVSFSGGDESRASSETSVQFSPRLHQRLENRLEAKKGMSGYLPVVHKFMRSAKMGTVLTCVKVHVLHSQGSSETCKLQKWYLVTSYTTSCYLADIFYILKCTCVNFVPSRCLMGNSNAAYMQSKLYSNESP